MHYYEHPFLCTDPVYIVCLFLFCFGERGGGGYASIPIVPERGSDSLFGFELLAFGM